jgi:hypothetical protein
MSSRAYTKAKLRATTIVRRLKAVLIIYMQKNSNVITYKIMTNAPIEHRKKINIKREKHNCETK